MEMVFKFKNIMITVVWIISALAINKTWAIGNLTPFPNKVNIKVNPAKSAEPKTEPKAEVQKGQTLTLDLTPYEKDLENIKKLQRDKVKLTLEKENRDLQKALGDDDSGNFRNLINKVYVIDILMTKKNNLARLYIPGRGITLAKVGDKIGDDINIVSINKDKVVATVQLPDAKQFKILPFHYGSS